MTLQTPTSLRRHWKLLAGLLLLLGAGAALIGVIAWKRSADAPTDNNSVANSTQNNPAAGSAAENKPKLLLSQYALPVNALAFSPDGRQLATAAADMRSRRGEVRLWNVIGWREERACQDFPGVVFSLAFSPNGKTLATGGKGKLIPGDRSMAGGEIKLWNLDAVATPTLWQKAGDSITSVAFNPQGDRLAAACDDGSLTLYNRATEQPEVSLRAAAGLNLFSNVAFSSDGKKIAQGGLESSAGPKPRSQGVVQVWDAATGKPTTALHPPKSQQGMPAIKSIAFIPDGDKLVASCGRTIYFWDLNSGHIEATLSGHQNQIESIALSRDGRLLASSDNGGCIKLWQVSTHSEQATLQNLMPTPQSPKEGMGLALAFAPDGQTLISSTLLLTGDEPQGKVKLWDVATAKEIALPR